MLVALDDSDGDLALDREIAALAVLLRDLRFLRSGRLPIDFDGGNASRLTEWRFALRPVACLEGKACGHPEIRNDRQIVTSPIVAISLKLGFARTRNRFYRLERDVRGRADA